MKSHNKGFAITSIIYSMLILFLTLVVLIIGNLASRKTVFDKQKSDILDKFEQSNWLPYEYQEVEYIKSTGSQYINTGFEPTKNTKIVTTIKFENYLGYTFNNSRIFTAVNCLEDREFGINFGSGEEQKNELFIWTTKIYNINTNISDWILNYISVDDNTTLNKNKMEMTYDWTTYGTYSINHKVSETQTWLDKNGNKMSTVNAPLYIFGGIQIPDIRGGEIGECDDNNIIPFSLYQYMYVYDFKIYENNVLKRDFVPCYRKSDNKAGLYDLVEDKFYTNNTGDDFQYGKEI